MSLPARLREVADGLAPSQQTRKRVQKYTDQIRRDLEEYFEDGPTINRIELLGSIGKKTSLWIKMDIDIVIYFNSVTPPFYDVINKLEDLVRSEYGQNYFATNHGIKFKYKEFHVDLLPATNFIPHRSKRDDVAKVQVENTLRYLSFHPNLRPDDFSTCLSEAAVDFLKSQDSFTHALCRLAKYWVMTVPIEGYCRGRSYIIELLAVRAADQTADLECGQNILEGFRKFLFMVRKISEQKAFWEWYYREEMIPSDFLQEAPYLMDPTNPFNNLLIPKVVRYLEKMKRFANRTLRFLKRAEDQSCYRIDRIFLRPSAYEGLMEDASNIPDNYLIGVEVIPSLHIPLLEIRRPGLRPKGIKTLLNVFSSFVYIVSHELELNMNDCEIEYDDKSNVLSCLGQFIGEDCFACNGSLNDRDVSLFLPIGRKTDSVVIVSFDWCDNDCDDYYNDY
ncbi:2'-5'-oligoadenylate synthase 1A-like isoform X2 [Apostichopus japonicus]|uniref:2'-5'-oligoadenylate synthase 1A-like isoform X2 n=1 Tax=Stichopus japonicus TaxID=307972 RepID=UPI003AB83FC4